MSNLKFKVEKIRKLVEQGENFVIDLKGILDVVSGDELLEMVENLASNLEIESDLEWNKYLIQGEDDKGLCEVFLEDPYLKVPTYKAGTLQLHNHKCGVTVVGTWKDFTKEVSK